MRPSVAALPPSHVGLATGEPALHKASRDHSTVQCMPVLVLARPNNFAAMYIGSPPAPCG